MPVLPGLTDRPADLENLARAASDAGACWFAANVLFLMPASRKQFFPFLAEKFPRLARQYEEWYARSGYAPNPTALKSPSGSRIYAANTNWRSARSRRSGGPNRQPTALAGALAEVPFFL